MKGLEEIIAIAWMLFAVYTLVLVLIGADLWSGIRKAKKRGEVRSSYGFKRTVNKIAMYYNALLALTVVDCMQMSSVWYLNNYYEHHIFMFPLITLVGAIGIGIVEIKSIYEKAEDKVKDDYGRAASLAIEIAKNKTNPKEIAEAIMEYLNEHKKDKDNG